jgi:beta-aspartyl-dipeptidase (metallo-type)
MPPPPRLTLLQGGEVYAPRPIGRGDLLLVGERIGRIGHVEPGALEGLRLPYEVVDASGLLVVPGFVDPHAHLIGAGGEQGFLSRTPEVSFEEIVAAGVTTIIGCLGTDTATRHLSSLVAKVRQFEAHGLSAYMLTGGFPVPPPTLLGSIQDDLVLIREVLGVGEVAVADARALDPTPRELARVATEALVGGSLSGKAGTTLIHVGAGRSRLGVVRAVLEQHEVPPDRLHVVHISRSEALMDEAIALAQRGVYVGIDTVDEDLPRWVRYYREHGGPPDQLTVCSDAHTSGGTHGKLHEQFAACVRQDGLPLEDVLRAFTQNVACAWRLEAKGALGEGTDADLLLLDRDTLEVRHVFARGRQAVRDREVVV